MSSFSVHCGPSEYILQEGALLLLEKKLIERGLNRVLVVHGEKSWEAAKPFWPHFRAVEYEEHTYGGECSIEEIGVVANKVRSEAFEAIVGVGGGKVLDLVKAVCDATRVQAVLVPTLASNCAPWTPLSVLYDESGAFIRYDIYPVCTSLVLIEPRILLGAPIQWLIAGIGDTLAKWYEANVQMEKLLNKSVALQISHHAARECKEVIFRHAKAALEAVYAGKLNEDFIKITEAIIVLGGMVGGFGDKYGRIAGAHSIHNGLTVLEETHHALHGDKVAYGILIQLIIEEKWDEIEELVPFYKEVGLPLSLTDLGVSNITKEVTKRIAEKAILPEESIHVMPIGQITAERVSEAILQFENRKS